MGVVAVWLALVGAAEWLGRAAEQPPELCLFRRVTGVPCPTCGTTRSVLAGLKGHFADAVLYNPMMTCVAIAALAWLILRIGFGRSVIVHLGRSGRVTAWCAVITLFLLNWAYIITRDLGT